jgi:hypothetical protein
MNSSESVVTHTSIGSRETIMSGKINAIALTTSDKDSENGQLVQKIMDSNVSKSEKIRQLYALLQDRSTVANLLNIKYQHVRNVLLTKLTTR